MSNSVTTVGFKEFQDKLKATPARMKRLANAEAYASAREWEALATKSAPVDQGRLKQSIGSKKGEGFSEVFCNVSYAPYIEWGTKGKADVPSDLQSYAAQFRGKGNSGDFYDFLLNLVAWVKRVGLGATYSTGIVKTKAGGYTLDLNRAAPRKSKVSDEKLLSIAYAIAFKILKNGLAPRPFFFIHKKGVEERLLTRLRDVFNERYL